MKEQRALVVNAADEAQVRAADSVTKTRKDSEREALLFVLSTAQGRQFIHWVLEWCDFQAELGIFRMSYLGDTNHMLVAEGRRNVGQEIVGAIMALQPAALLQIMQEAKKLRENTR